MLVEGDEWRMWKRDSGAPWHALTIAAPVFLDGPAIAALPYR